MMPLLNPRNNQSARNGAQPAPSGDTLEEYKSVCEFMRQYDTRRFYQFALLFGTTASVITAVSAPGVTTNFAPAEMLKLGGLVTTVGFLVMEFRATSYWHVLRDRANELADLLRFMPFPRQSRWNPLTSSGVSFYMHVLVASLWLVSLLLHLSTS